MKSDREKKREREREAKNSLFCFILSFYVSLTFALDAIFVWNKYNKIISSGKSGIVKITLD